MVEINDRNNTNKIIKQVERIGIETGSFYFGYENYHDIDYVIEDKVWNDLCNYYAEWYLKSYYVANKFKECGDNLKILSVKLYKNNDEKTKPINIILVGNKDNQLKIWKRSSDKMKKLLSENPILFDICKEKSFRVELFEKIKLFYSNIF